MKGKFHRSCSCDGCRVGRRTKAGQEAQRQNERKLRQEARRLLREFEKGADDVVIAPISSPYTD